MIAGGVTVVEVTMTVPGAIDLLRDLKQKYGHEILLGSGTVTTAKEAEATIEAGAEFVVSPSLHPEVIAATKAAHKLSVPGALTPTEVIAAHRAGADYVKIFPCSAVGGAPYLKALLAPFPFLKLIPTGGVTIDSAESFLKAGARALGRGRRPRKSDSDRRRPARYHHPGGQRLLERIRKIPHLKRPAVGAGQQAFPHGKTR